MTIPGIIYLAALIFGLGVQALQIILSGSDADADAHADADGSLDVAHDMDAGDVDAAADHDVGGHHAEAGAGFLPVFLSLRFWTFGALAFGLAGSMLHFLHLAPSSVTPFVALGLGLSCGFFVSWALKALTRANTQSGAGPNEAVGQLGKVLVPVKPGLRGKVRIQIRGQTTDFLALSDDGDFEAGADVLVTEMEDGQVRVARAPNEFVSGGDD